MRTTNSSTDGLMRNCALTLFAFNCIANIPNATRRECQNCAKPHMATFFISPVGLGVRRGNPLNVNVTQIENNKQKREAKKKSTEREHSLPFGCSDRDVNYLARKKQQTNCV